MIEQPPPRRRRPDLPRLAPGDAVVVAGPEAPYVVASLETSGADAVLRLRTEDGLDWIAKRRTPTEVPRHVDEEARQFYAAEPVPESLAAARVGIEHVQHHGQPLQFTGSSFVGDLIVHRFACTDPTCRVRLDWSVTS